MCEHLGHAADPEDAVWINIPTGFVVHNLLAAGVEIYLSIGCGCSSNEGR
jgi:hypothetical protein